MLRLPGRAELGRIGRELFATASLSVKSKYSCFRVKIYTKKGDDGTTGLLYGGRVSKDAPQIEINGAVDEAQAFIGLARAEAGEGELEGILTSLEVDLWILMAEVATGRSRRSKLVPGKSLVTAEMVAKLEALIDSITGRFTFPNEFAVPGQNKVSALLDVARTIVRRAERLGVTFSRENPEAQVGPYLNRLSDLLWTLARWQEDVHLTSKEASGAGHKSQGVGN